MSRTRRPTVRLTTAEALVRWLVAQRTVVDGRPVPLFPGVFAVFGHANVTCLGEALQRAADRLPTWRGQNEQGMALAATAFAKATRRRQVMVATSSIGPGALNMVTAAGVAMADRLPLLLLAGDTFASRLPDPVLQQVEHPGAPSTTANDAFRAVVRYWDRLVRPEQLLQSLPQALRVLRDPAECGPVLLALPQDTQGEAFDFPAAFFAPALHGLLRPRPDRHELSGAAQALRTAERPLVVAGGGVHYAAAEDALSRFAARHRLPVAETVAGKASLRADDAAWVGPIGVCGWAATNRLARAADVVLAVGTRLADFTTGSWTVFDAEQLRVVGLNVARFDAVKHAAHSLVCDALVGLEELSEELGEWQGPAGWAGRGRRAAARGRAAVRSAVRPREGMPTYAQVVGTVNRLATPDDYVLTAAGGLPGELNANWLASATGCVDVEYGFSCMGYEIAGGWGAAMARRRGEVFVLVGDGSYLMLNSDLYSSVLSGHKMIVVVCDNAGFAVIDRLQRQQGEESFRTMLTERYGPPVDGGPRVDFAAHARALGCKSEVVGCLSELEQALQRARRAERTTVVVVRTDPDAWSRGGSFWEVGVPEVSERAPVRAARRRLQAAKAVQRVGP